MSENVITRQGKAIEAPSILTRLFTDTRFAILWLPIRVWLGMQWIQASLHKLPDPAWMKTGVHVARQGRRIFGVDRCRSAGKDETARLEGKDFLAWCVPRKELAVNMRFAYPPGNELCLLRAKIYDSN